MNVNANEVLLMFKIFSYILIYNAVRIWNALPTETKLEGVKNCLWCEAQSKWVKKSIICLGPPQVFYGHPRGVCGSLSWP